MEKIATLRSPLRVIFLNRYFHPDQSATSQIVTSLALHLVREGFDVTVLTSRQLYDQPLASLPANEIVEGVRVRRLWTTRFGRITLGGRLVDYATFYISALVELFRLPLENAIVVAKTDPPLISLVAALAVDMKGGILINWIQDLFPELAEEVGVVRKEGIIANVLRRLRNATLRMARVNVVPGALMAERVTDVGGRAEVIANWADENLRPIDRSENELRREWGLQDSLVVAHSGNLGRAHDHETILGAMQQLASNQKIRFLFIGGGSGFATLWREASRLGLANAQFRPYQPRERLSESLSIADIHLITLRPHLEGFVVPSKFYGVAAVGRPLIYIGHEQGDIARTIVRARCGIVVSRGDVAQLVEAIERLADDELRTSMGRAARDAHEEHFRPSFALDTWTKTLRAL